MNFKSEICLDQQVSNDINKAQHNVLKVFTPGADMVFLDVSGCAMADLEGRSSVFTIMKVEEAELLSRMLLDAIQAATSDAWESGAHGRPYGKLLSQRYPLNALQKRNLQKQETFFKRMSAAGEVAA